MKKTSDHSEKAVKGDKKSKKANLENKKLLFIEVGLCFSLFVTLAAFQWGTRDANVSVLEEETQMIEEEERNCSMLKV